MIIPNVWNPVFELCGCDDCAATLKKSGAHPVKKIKTKKVATVAIKPWCVECYTHKAKNNSTICKRCFNAKLSPRCKTCKSGEATPGHSSCQRCRLMSAKRAKARRRRLRDAGICCRCARNKSKPGHVTCAVCIDKMASR